MRPSAPPKDEENTRLDWSKVLWLDIVSFLFYYGRLRFDVLRGTHKTVRPLGIGYRWRDWQYQQHLKRVENKSWGS